MILAYLGSPSQWIILILVCLVIFGAKRLPEIARGLGKSLGEFKKARREFEEELMESDKPAAPRPAPKTIEEAPPAAPKAEHAVSADAPAAADKEPAPKA